MQLLGSSIYVTSTFYGLEGASYLVHWTHSFLYLHITAGIFTLQDGIFHKKNLPISGKMRMDKRYSPVLY